MLRTYLQLSVLLFILFQSCRPSTNDQTGFSSPSGDSTQQTTSHGEDTTSAPNDTSSLLMHGNVGSSGDFMVSAAEAGLTEVKLAELALERSNSAKVKEFAQMMLKDHNTANVELSALAKKRSVSLPSSLCMECRATYDALSKKKGKEFDSTYMQLMVKDHRAVLQQFVFQSDKGGDSLVKKWAADKIPTLQHHLNTAENWRRSY
jgi:putative membrane protein